MRSTLGNMRSERISLFIITVCLLALGIVMIYSVTSVRAFENFGDSFYYAKRQLVFMFLGLITGIFILTLDHRHLQKYAKWIFVFALILLGLVLVPGIGHKIGGARRWFKLGALNFQPSEFAKLALIIYLADLFSRKKLRINLFWKGFVPAIGVIGTVFLLIVIEPDLGAAIVAAVIGFVLLFLAGINLKYLFFLGAAAVPSIGALIIFKPYRFRRLLAFFNPWADKLGAGHQVIQSMITIGNGGLCGKGLGHSIQKLYYLPAAHTDFIFSVIAEELGLLGGGVVLVLFGLLLWTGFKISLNVRDGFCQLLSSGLLALIALQVFIHIGVTTAILPTKGLPLPFISYGGTNLLFNMIAIALLVNISKNAN